MRHEKGFSLIELLIVVAIILIIAAIAIPNLLQARMAANEASGVGSIQALKTAEITYFNTYPSVGYADKLADLSGASPCTPSSTSACLIDSFLAASTPGSVGKSGYVFLATGISAGGVNSAFVVGTSPVNVNRTGNRDFCSTNDGVLRQVRANPGDTPVNDIASCLAFPVAQ
jgi:prepilin-type N-terminal cleavage/methylation domain-containing protein